MLGRDEDDSGAGSGDDSEKPKWKVGGGFQEPFKLSYPLYSSISFLYNYITKAGRWVDWRDELEKCNSYHTKTINQVTNKSATKGGTRWNIMICSRQLRVRPGITKSLEKRTAKYTSVWFKHNFFAGMEIFQSA